MQFTTPFLATLITMTMAAPVAKPGFMGAAASELATGLAWGAGVGTAVSGITYGIRAHNRHQGEKKEQNLENQILAAAPVSTL